MIQLSQDRTSFIDTGGQPFFVFGVNYLGPADRPWQLWSQFDEALVRRDFEHIAACGLNTVRLFSSPALLRATARADFSTLDRVIQFAANHQLRVLFTLSADQPHPNAAGEHVPILLRYREDPVLLGWDLADRPTFFTILGPHAPAWRQLSSAIDDTVAALDTPITMAEATRLQAAGALPKAFSPPQAYRYANLHQAWLRFEQTAQRWLTRQPPDAALAALDFIYHPEAANWRPLIKLLNDALAAWLKPHLALYRRHDPQHLFTLTHHQPLLAALPANRSLDFNSLSSLVAATPAAFDEQSRQLLRLQARLPQQPFVLSEFGWANQTNSNPGTSHSRPDSETARYEVARLVFLRAHHFAGGLKWRLNDSDPTFNPQAAGYGVYHTDGQAKAIRTALPYLRQYWAQLPGEGTIRYQLHPAGPGFRLDFPDAGPAIVLGGTYQDEHLSWQSDGAGLCFIDADSDSLHLHVSEAGALSLQPEAWHLAWRTDSPPGTLCLNVDDGLAVAEFAPPQLVTLKLRPGQSYQLQPTPAPAIDLATAGPQLDPASGEHVLILPNAEQGLQAAMRYIQHFGPDIRFGLAGVAERWMYITVVASATQVSDADLDALRAAGARYVERIDGDATATLNDMVAQNRRFSLGNISPNHEKTASPVADKTVSYYQVKPGDTLSSIAQAVYQQAAAWEHVWQANRDKLAHPDDLRPGLQLRLPPPGANIQQATSPTPPSASSELPSP